MIFNKPSLLLFIIIMTLWVSVAMTICEVAVANIFIREFKKLLRRRQRQRDKTIGSNEKNKGPARAY